MIFVVGNKGVLKGHAVANKDYEPNGGKALATTYIVGIPSTSNSVGICGKTE